MAQPTSSAPSTPSVKSAFEFPYWPFTCTAFYSTMARDFGRYAQTLTQATDGMDALRAEGDYGVSLFHDLMRGYYNLALRPYIALVETLAPAAEAPPKAQASKAQASKAQAPAIQEPAPAHAAQ